MKHLWACAIVLLGALSLGCSQRVPDDIDALFRRAAAGPGITITPASGLNTTENSGTVTFQAVLDTPPVADVTIALSSSDTSEGTLTISSLSFNKDDWHIAQSVLVTGVDDLESDGPVQYLVVTAPAVSTDTDYSGIDALDVQVTNADNDTPGITVTQTTGLVTTESLGQANFDIVLGSQPTANVVINLTSSNTNEGTVSPASLSFSNADWNQPQTVNITGVDDDVVDGSQVYSIITGAAVSSDLSYNGLDAADISVSNSDNDTAGITVTPTTGLSTSEAGGTAQFTVVLVSEPTASVTIGLSSNNLAEGTVAPPSLVFTIGNWSTAQTVTITGVDDAAADGAIAYTIATAAATSGDTNYNGMNADDVSVSNSDNETAGITVSPTSGLVTTEAAGTAQFTVVLDTLPAASVSIALSSTNTAEGTILPTSLTFTPGDWNVAQPVTITGVDDVLFDGNVVYTIQTAAATSGDPTYNNFDAADVSVTNNDNEPLPGFTVTPTSGLVTTELGGTAQFTVVLNSPPTATVTVGISSADAGEGTAAPASLSFTTGNWSSAQTVTITGQPDSQRDGAIAYSIVTAAATSSDGDYNGLNGADVAVSNTDADRFMFVSASTTLGNIGTTAANAIVNADGLCNTDANRPDTGVTYKAFLSNTARIASLNGDLGDGQVDWILTANTEYYQTNGTSRIFTTNANRIFILWDAVNPVQTGVINYWTGLKNNWENDTTDCAEFTDGSGGNGSSGETGVINNDILYRSNNGCEIALPLLCVEQ